MNGIASDPWSNIENHRPEKLQGEFKRAAVAIAIEGDASASTFLLTLRSNRLRDHAAQYALPGGKLEPGESSTDAALRELAEEIGDPDWEVVGHLDDYPTQSGYVMTPVVVRHAMGAARLQIDPNEVEEVYRVPVESGFQLLETSDSDLSDGGMELRTGPFQVFPPTGAIIYQFLELWFNGRAVRVSGYREPPFARR